MTSAGHPINLYEPNKACPNCGQWMSLATFKNHHEEDCNLKLVTHVIDS
jgi:hypothetical protein